MATDSTCPNSICKYRNRVTGHCTYSGPCVESVYTTIERKETKMPEVLTKMGYDMIIERIVNRTVQPPDDMTVEMLNTWLTGYAKCQNDVLEIIGKLKDQTGGNE